MSKQGREFASPPENSRELPIEERWTTVQGGRMRFLQGGSGPALVLLHGLLGYSFSWRFALPVLAKESTVYAPDMLGAGFSECPSNLECTFSGCARRVLSFTEQVGISSFDLLGTSHGGAVAMMAAAMANQEQLRVKSLILVAPVNPWSAHGRRLAPFLSSGLVSTIFPAVKHAPFFDAWVLRRLYGDTRKIAPGTLEGYRKPLEASGSLKYLLQIFSSWGKDLQELEGRLSGIENLPALILWGSLDRAVDPASADALKSHFRNARSLTLEGVGHLPYEESPERFNEIVSQFLRETRQASRRSA